jgi:hypothetical protein
MYNIVQHNIRNEAIMLQDFHINSPDGRLGKHPPQGRWEGYVEADRGQLRGASIYWSRGRLTLIR